MSARDLPVHEILGDGSTTIFLLHGMYGAKEYRTPEAERLGYRVVAWDAPGYGSSPLLTTFSLNSLTDEAARLITELGSDSNVVMGQSMGGQLVFRVYARIPEHISAVVNPVGFNAKLMSFLTHTVPVEA
jgi:3-oxoadipate enol-lactonase